MSDKVKVSLEDLIHWMDAFDIPAKKDFDLIEDEIRMRAVSAQLKRLSKLDASKSPPPDSALLKAREIARTAIADWEPEHIAMDTSPGVLEDFQNLGDHLVELITEALLDQPQGSSVQSVSDEEIKQAFRLIRAPERGSLITEYGYFEAGYRAALERVK
jgi:hypothetical protein